MSRRRKQVLKMQDVEQMAQGFPLAVILTNSAGEIVGANGAALDLFKYPRESLLGKDVEVLLPARYALRHRALFGTFLSDPRPRQLGRGRDLAARRFDEVEFPVEVGLAAMPTEPPCFLATIIDLTIRREAEKILQQKQAPLESDLLQTRRHLEEQVAASTRMEERQRLGRELHDSLSQNLYGIGLGLSTAMARVGKGDNPSEALAYCLTLTESALVEMRALLFKLRPQSLENVPLADVLESHTRATALRTPLKVTFEHLNGCGEQLDYDKKYALYRIATEALHNCLKHAIDASGVEIVLRSETAYVELTVSDDGPGFANDIPHGHGMSTMRERAEATRGTLEVVTGPHGTFVRASIPR